jgi:hypothetical protein
LRTGHPLSTRHTLRAGLALSAGLSLFALRARLARRPRNAWCALRTGWTLSAGISLGTGGSRIPAASGEHQRRPNNDHRHDFFHVILPQRYFPRIRMKKAQDRNRKPIGVKGRVILFGSQRKQACRNRRQNFGLRRFSSVSIEASLGGKLVNSEIARANCISEIESLGTVSSPASKPF